MHCTRFILSLIAILIACCGVQAHVLQPGTHAGALYPAEVISFPDPSNQIPSFRIETPTISEWSSGWMFSGSFLLANVGVKRLVPGCEMVWIGCQSNPVNAVDPDGNRTIFVHGTWSNPAACWSDSFKLEVLRNLGEIGPNIARISDALNSFTDVDWSFKTRNNTSQKRLEGAQLLLQAILNAPQDEPINIVTHSHGGNVGFLASQLLAENNRKTGQNIRINNFIAISPPIRDDYRPEMSVIGSLNIVSNAMDGVQLNGGKGYSADLGTFIFMLSKGRLFSEEMGSAGRTLNMPGVNNILFNEEELWSFGLGFANYGRAHSFPKEAPSENRNFWHNQVYPRLNLLVP